MSSHHILLSESDRAKPDISDIIEPISIKIPNELSGMRLDVALATIIPELSRNRLTNWIKKGHVLVNNQKLNPKDKIFGNEDVVVIPIISDEALAFTPENIPLEVIYVDEHILIINKPAGLTVHPGNNNWSGTLLNALLYHYPELHSIPRAGIVHRLDKDTTGLMVVARTLSAQTNLVRQLQKRSIERIYRALVIGTVPKAGTIEKNIGRDAHNRTKMTTLELGGRVAITHYRVLYYLNNFSYIECKLETGRTHQIRVHLKSIGHPLVGDPVYGSKKINCAPNIINTIKNLDRQALHALKLSFIHPQNNQIMSFKIPLANDIKLVLAQLNLELDQNNVDPLDNLEDKHEWEIIYAK